MRYPEYRLNEVGFRARLYDVNHIPLEKGIGSIIRRVPKVVPYDNDARDADGDGLVQEGTIWERPAGTRWVSKLGSALSSGLRAIPGNSKIVDKDGNDVDYKPGDKAQGGRAKLRGLLARRRLRRAGKRRRRAAERREEDRERKAPEEYDKLIETLENAANAASQERLIEAEKQRGDAPMDGPFRSFWDTFMEAFTGMKGGREDRNSRDKARGRSAIRKTLQMEGNRRTAGDENGNEPDHDREKEFDEEALDGKGVMPSAIEEHHRKLREDPEYRKRWNRALREGKVDQFIEKEGLRPIPDGGDRDPDRPRPRIDPKPPTDAPEAGKPLTDLTDDELQARIEALQDINDDMSLDDLSPAHQAELDALYEERNNRWLRGEGPRPRRPEPDDPEADVEPGFELPDEVIESIEHYRDTVLPELSDQDLAQELAELREALNADDLEDRFPRNDGPERFALALQEHRRRLVQQREERNSPEAMIALADAVSEEDLDQAVGGVLPLHLYPRDMVDNPRSEEAVKAFNERIRERLAERDEARAARGLRWSDERITGASDEELQRRRAELVALDPVGNDSAIRTELERLESERIRREVLAGMQRDLDEYEESDDDLPGDAFFDNEGWIEGDFAWDDDAIDAAINVALATDDTRTIEGIERSLQRYKYDMTTSEWRGAKGRRHREIQAILDRRREERERPTRTVPPRDVDPYGDDEFGFMSDEDLQRHIDDLENIEDRSPDQEARLEALGNEYDERFGTEADVEDMEREERLEWYETDPASLSDEELQTEINELNSESDLDDDAMAWLTKLSEEDDRRQKARNEQEDQEAAEAEAAEEARQAELIEEQRDPRDMTPEEMAEEINAINEADEDELNEHWGSSEAAMDRYNVLQDALSEREEQDARDRDQEEIEDRIAEQDDPTEMRDEDIGEEMSELFDISEDEDYNEEARAQARQRWELLAAEQDRREREREQDERDLSDALDERQAEEDAEEDRIREAEEREAEEAAEAEAAREAEIEAEERQVRVDEHENNPPSSLSEEDLANEIAELSDSEIMDDLDRDRLNDLEAEVERRMEAAARREDSNRGERSRSLRFRDDESLQEELDELMEDPDADEARMDALEAELDRRETQRSRRTRERTRERTDELEAAEQREYEGEGEDDEEILLPEVEPDYSDEDEEDAGGPTDGDLIDPYAEMERDMTTPPPDEEDEEDDIDESGARPIPEEDETPDRTGMPDEGGSGPNGEWTDADEAADPADDRFAELEDKLDSLDWNIHAAMAAGDDEQVLGYLLRREELLEDDGGLIGTHREIMRHEHDAEILRYLTEHEYKDGAKAREDGGPSHEHYENNQKYLNVYAEAQKRGLLDPDPDPVDDSPEADLPDPLEGKTPEVAEAEEAIRRDWDGYSPEEKEYLALHFVDTEVAKLEQGLIDGYRGKSAVTVPPLPDDATPEEREISALQQSYLNAKEATFQLLARRDMSGTLGGIDHSVQEQHAFTGDISARQILAAHIFDKLDQADLSRVIDALNPNTNMLGNVPYDPNWSRMDFYDDFDNRDIPSGIVALAVKRMQDKMQADGTVVTDEQVAEAMSELEVNFAAPLGEAMRAELDRQIKRMGSEELGGTADPFLLNLILPMGGPPTGIDAMNTRNSFMDDLWSPDGYGRMHSADLLRITIGAPNVGKGMGEIGRLIVEDLDVGFVPQNMLHNPDLLIQGIIQAYARQLSSGAIDEATFVNNLKSLPADLAKGYRKHATAGLAASRSGPGARLHRDMATALFGKIGAADEASAREMFDAGVKLALFKSAEEGDLRHLALDGVIDVQMPLTETEVVAGLIRKFRVITDVPVSFGTAADGGSLKWEPPITSRGRKYQLNPSEQQAAANEIEAAAALLLPDDWIDLSNSSGRVVLYKQDLDRASFGSKTTLGLEAAMPEGVGTSDGAIDITRKDFTITDGGHEIVHRIQSVNVFLLLQDDAFARRRQTPATEAEARSPKFRKRTFNTILGRTGMGSESAIEDHFSLPYMGKAYKSRRGDLRIEVSSTGVELLLGGKVGAGHRPKDQQRDANGIPQEYTLADALAEDRSSSWIGHVLAMLVGV